MARLQSGEGRMMIDSVIWAQHINVTDTQTDSHVAIANAAPTQYASGGEMSVQFANDSQLSIVYHLSRGRWSSG